MVCAATAAVRAVCRWTVTMAGIEAALRKRRVRRGVRVDEWVGWLLREEVVADPASGAGDH